jgi:Cu2+-exporting ATPase
MSEMLTNNPLLIMEQKQWNWIQFALPIRLFYTYGYFFERATTEIIKTWNLIYLPLIGIGAGVACYLVYLGCFFPDFFQANLR